MSHAQRRKPTHCAGVTFVVRAEMCAAILFVMALGVGCLAAAVVLGVRAAHGSRAGDVAAYNNAVTVSARGLYQRTRLRHPVMWLAGVARGAAGAVGYEWLRVRG